MAQSRAPEIIGFLPAAGPEGTRVEIRGKNLQNVSAVLFGITPAVFDPVSPKNLMVIVPHRVPTSIITVIASHGQSSSRLAFVVSNDPRIPHEVSYKAGYVNAVPRPPSFGSARMWGIAIADTRVPGHKSAQVEVAWTRLSCQVDSREVVLNDDGSQVRGGLHSREPWFGTDEHDPMPLAFDLADQGVCCAWESAPIAYGILESISARRLAAGQTRRLHGSCPSQDFYRRLVADGDGLLALSYDSVWLRRKQSRSRRQRLALSLSPVARSVIHRCRRPAILAGSRKPGLRPSSITPC